MTFQTTFDLEVFIKSCNALRLSVCSDGEATLDKWIALATKKSVDGKITFTKQIVRNMNRYADAIADTGVSYVYGEDDEFSPELQLCLWALSPRYRVGSVLQIGEHLETLRWVAVHYAERFDAELEGAIKDINYRRRLKYQTAFPTSPMTLKYVRTLDQVLANYNFDASTADCIENLYKEVDYYGHSRDDNKVITLIYQQLDTLLDNNISLITLINTISGRHALAEIFKSPKAFAQYWERLAAYGLKTEDRDGVKTVVDYSDWFINLSIKVRGFLDVLNELWDVHLPSTTTGVCVVSKHYEIVGQLPLEDKAYFTNLPLSAIQSLYPDFKVTSFQDFINGEPVDGPIIITYPERRTMAHVLLNAKQDNMETPTRVNHSVIYVGWPVAFTRNHLNIVEYDGVLEIVERESPYMQRFASLHQTKPNVSIGDLYRDSSDKPYALDYIVKEELGSEKIKFDSDVSFTRGYGRNVRGVIGGSENNMSTIIGRGLTMPRIFNDYDPSDMHISSMVHRQGVPGTMSDLLDQWTRQIREPRSDFDGDELNFTINKTSRMEHVHRVSNKMAETMNEIFKNRHDGHSEPDVVCNTVELPGDMVDRQTLTPFNHHGSPSRLQMAVGVVDIAEAYPNSYIGIDLASNTDKE